MTYSNLDTTNSRNLKVNNQAITKNKSEALPLIDIQEASSTNSSADSRRIAQLKSQLSEQKLMVEHVSRKLKASEESLQEEKSLREEYFDKFINSEADAPSGVTSEWLKKYISFQKAPANIFKDYSKLHQEHETLKLQCKISSDLANSFRRQQSNDANKIERLESELNSFQAKESELKSQINELKAQVEQIQNDRDNKQKESDKHKAESEKFKKAISDLQLQMKVILNHIEGRHESIPAAQQQTYELLMKEYKNPVLPSNSLTADDIHQIQDLNVNLQFQVRNAYKNVANLEKQVESLKADGQESKIQADKALQKCNETIDMLKEDLAKSESEKENLIAQITSQEQIQDVFDDCKKETEAILEKMQDDLLAEYKATVSNWELEKKSLQNDVDRWSSQSGLYQDELKDVKAESAARLNKIYQLEDSAKEAEATLSKVKDTVHELNMQSEDIKEKLEFSEKARQSLKKQLEDGTTNKSTPVGKIDQLSDISAESKKKYKDNELNVQVQEPHSNIDNMKNESIAQKDSEIAKLRTASLEFTPTLNPAEAGTKNLLKQSAEPTKNRSRYNGALEIARLDSLVTKLDHISKIATELGNPVPSRKRIRGVGDDGGGSPTKKQHLFE